MSEAPFVPLAPAAFPWDVTETGVAVDPIPEPSMTEGKIILPEVARRKPLRGAVVAIGPDVKDTRIKIGAEVMYGRYAGCELDVEVGKRKILLLREADVRLVRKGEGA